MKPFKVKLIGSIYAHIHTLFDNNGEYVYDLQKAINIAEEYYFDEWYEIFNGIESIDYDTYKNNYIFIKYEIK